MRYLSIFLVFLVFLYSCSTSTNTSLKLSEQGSVFSHVNVINIRDGSIDSNKSVVVDSGKIVAILEENRSWPEGTQIINGEGNYLLPGLAEMHAHIPSPQESEEWIQDVLFLYVAQGVTTIRGMLGHPRHLDLREEAANNSILSPRIYTSSPSFNGNSVKTPEEGRQKVIESRDAGYDFLKFHPGIKLEVHDEIVKTANEEGIPYAGHVSTDVGIRHALESNYASVDHIDGFLEGLVPESAGVNPNDNGFFGYNFTNLVDTTMIDELVQSSKKHRVWVVPTQALFDRWFSPRPAEELATDPEMKYMPASTIQKWIENKNRLTGGDHYSDEQWNTFNEIRKQMILKLHREGQGLILGSDAPQVFNVPGFSIHHELQFMLDAGLSPLEALQTGTLHPALYFDQEGEYGEIIEDASADFILSAENPLEDLSTLREPVGVMVRGQWLSKERIDTKLAELADRNLTR